MASPSVANLQTFPSPPDLPVARAELASIVTSVTRVQGWVSELMRRYEQQHRVLEARVEELEREKESASTECTRLKVKYADLKRRLNHARVVIQDLLQERESRPDLFDLDQPVPTSTVNRHRSLVQLQDLQLYRRRSPTNIIRQSDELSELLLAESDEPTGDSDSDDTVRGAKQATEERPPPTIPIMPPGTGPSRERLSRLPEATVDRHRAEHHGRSEATSTSLHSALEIARVSENVVAHATDSNKDSWNIQYKKAPVSKALLIGPIKWEDLPARVGLEINVLDSLENLQMERQFCLHVQIVDDMAFVYDPIVLEIPNASYLLEWGKFNANADIDSYINDRAVKPLHTFIYPVAKASWFYIGAMTWTPRDIQDSLWPTLSISSREKLTAKLRERSHGDFNQDSIARMLDEGVLQQFCVQVSSAAHVDASRRFAQRMGFEVDTGAGRRSRKR